MKLRVALVGCVVAALSACGSPPTTTIRAGSDINGGTIPISQAATYQFSLTGSCGSTGAEFRLISDSGTTDYLHAGPSSGQLYLSVGNWNGGYGVFGLGNVWFPAGVCSSWHLTLTAPD